MSSPLHPASTERVKAPDMPVNDPESILSYQVTCPFSGSYLQRVNTLSSPQLDLNSECAAGINVLYINNCLTKTMIAAFICFVFFKLI